MPIFKKIKNGKGFCLGDLTWNDPYTTQIWTMTVHNDSTYTTERWTVTVRNDSTYTTQRWTMTVQYNSTYTTQIWTVTVCNDSTYTTQRWTMTVHYNSTMALTNRNISQEDNCFLCNSIRCCSSTYPMQSLFYADF